MSDQLRYAVYELYASSTEIIYIGQTSRLVERLSEHRFTAPWWAEVNPALTAVTWHATREAAERAELALIAAKLPKWNVQGIDGRYFGQQTDGLAPDHAEIAARLEAITDPADRAREAAAQMDAVREESLRLSRVRHQALLEMRASGVSVVKISHGLGIHRDRVYRLLRVASTT